MCFCLCVPKLCCFPSILCPCLSCLPMCVKGLKFFQCLVVNLEGDEVEKNTEEILKEQQRRESQSSSRRDSQLSSGSQPRELSQPRLSPSRHSQENRLSRIPDPKEFLFRDIESRRALKCNDTFKPSRQQKDSHRITLRQTRTERRECQTFTEARDSLVRDLLNSDITQRRVWQPSRQSLRRDSELSRISENRDLEIIRATQRRESHGPSQTELNDTEQPKCSRQKDTVEMIDAQQNTDSEQQEGSERIEQNRKRKRDGEHRIDIDRDNDNEGMSKHK